MRPTLPPARLGHKEQFAQRQRAGVDAADAGEFVNDSPSVVSIAASRSSLSIRVSICATARSIIRRWASTALARSARPAPEGRARRVEGQSLAVQLDRAGIRLKDPADAADQRALARAVLADQAVNLAGRDVEIDAAQRVGTAEGFVQVTQSQAPDAVGQ